MAFAMACHDIVATFCTFDIMANNTTFILPQWLIAKEPGMNCRSHQYILDMFAAYNLVAIILSVILASPFFVNISRNVQQVILPWNWCKDSGGSDEESSPLVTVISFIATVLGSIAIALAAPLLAGNTIVKNHPTVNRWTIIEQWSTRPRVSIFVFVFNLIAAKLFEGNDTQGFIKTAASSLVSEIVMELFGIKFLMNQSSVSLQKFDPKLPCTEPASDAGQIPANCPAMQQGAIGLVVVILINAVLVVLLFLCLPCTGLAI
ncbi:hypothetical protein B7463_g4012, partial [Scytalidium lignicola]